MIETFSPEAMRTIQRVMRRLVREEINLLPKPPLRTPRQLGVYVGKVKTTITARSGTTPGTGTADLFSATTVLAQAIARTGDDLVAITVHSLLTSSVAVGEYVVLQQDQLSGKYWVLQAVETGVPNPGQVLIKNNTGAVIPIYNVLSIDSHIEDPATDLADYQASPPTFGGNYTSQGSPGDWGRYAVLQEEAAIGATVSAIVSGVTVVEVDNRTGSHPWPFVDLDNNASSTMGQQEWYGSGEILDVQDGTGTTRWAWIRMSHYQSPKYRATADGTITADSSGSATIQYNALARESVTVYNDWMEGGASGHDIGSGDEMLIYFNREQDHWKIVSLEC